MSHYEDLTPNSESMPAPSREQIMSDQIGAINALCDVALEGVEGAINWERQYDGEQLEINIDRIASAQYNNGELYVDQDVPVATMITLYYPCYGASDDSGALGIGVLDNGLIYVQQGLSAADNLPLRMLPPDALAPVEDLTELVLDSVLFADDSPQLKTQNETRLIDLARTAADAITTSDTSDDRDNRLDAQLAHQLKVLGTEPEPYATFEQTFARKTHDETQIVTVTRYPYAETARSEHETATYINWIGKSDHKTALLGRLTINVNGRATVMGNPVNASNGEPANEPTQFRRAAQPAEMAAFLKLLQDTRFQSL